MKILLAALLVLGSPLAQERGGVRFPAKPAPREFIVDQANLIRPDEAAEIRILADEALTRKKAPIVVVTIPSLASVGAAGWPIERYAMNLMSEWGVGYEDWNYGMLLLVSSGDRKARIELGGSWARRKDEEAKRVMSQRIIPRFKQGDYSKGILEGVRGLQQVALDAVPARSPSPSPTTPSAPRVGTPEPLPAEPDYGSSSGGGVAAFGGCGLLLILIVGFIVVTAIARMLRGPRVTSWGSRGPYGGGYYRPHHGGGFGSGFGGGLLGGVLGGMLGSSLGHGSSSRPSSSSSSTFSDSSSSSDSDFGGGSFGGGFSGGGGATGEW